MTPCWICGTPMDEINVDPIDLKPAPCSECQSVITQTVEEMGVEEQLEFPFDDELLDEDFAEDRYSDLDYEFETYDEYGVPW